MATEHITGRVFQVNISGGGVPKRPVDRAWVGTYGLEGDSHREYTVHGGPHQAVCLYGIEAIERLQSEGHPVDPGSVGENLTTVGVDWSLLPIGTRARIGDQLELEVASSATPCKTQIHNFRDGKFSRMSIDLHPSDSRMYARVLCEGEVKPGDEIVISAAPADSMAEDLLRLYWLDRVSMKADVASWRAAQQSGFEIDIVEDGDVALAAAKKITGPAFNHGMGFAGYPNLLDMVIRFYDERGTPGWVWTDEDPPWGGEPEITTSIFAGAPTDIPDFPGPEGLTVRHIAPEDATRFISVYGDQMANNGIGEGPNPWPQVYQKLARWPHRWLFMAEIGDRPVGAASLHTHGKVAWLRGGVVAPDARGNGIQRALIAARARQAEEEGCTIIGSMAESEGPSATNLHRMRLRQIGTRRQFAYTPAAKA
jgi:MOSC domain-containing protein YiiM/GNAT superfamily N-acetyltransferase